MSTQGGFNFERAQAFLTAQNLAAVNTQVLNALYSNEELPEFHDRRCMAIALGNGMYNIDFIDGGGDMVVSIEELVLDLQPTEVIVEERVDQNITQEERDVVAEEQIPSRIRVLICGDKEWINIKPIKEFLENLPRSTIIIHGAAKGADTIAGRIATSLGMEVKIFSAQLEEEGNAAEPLRNTQMLHEGNPDAVVYFHNSVETSKDTKDMLEQAEKAGVKVMNGSPGNVVA
jgi:hypothetical protein